MAAVVAVSAKEGCGMVQLWGGKLHCLGNALSSGFSDVDLVASVVFWSTTKVPAVNAMWSPGAWNFRVFVDKDFGAWWG